VAGEKAEAALALCAEHGLALFAARGTLVRGLALADLGQRTPGMQLMRQGLDALRTLQAQFFLLQALVLVAEACWKLGHRAEGYALLTEAMTSMEHTQSSCTGMLG
jgi:hypothetical protein